MIPLTMRPLMTMSEILSYTTFSTGRQRCFCCFGSERSLWAGFSGKPSIALLARPRKNDSSRATYLLVFRLEDSFLARTPVLCRRGESQQSY